MALPDLERMRGLLRIGMTTDEFFAMLDELAEDGVRFSSPTLSKDLIGIFVAEGDQLLCFLTASKLVYVEYRGGIFLGG